MKNLYIVETGRGVRAECRLRKYAELQAEEYLNNYGGTVLLYHYIIENPDIRYQCEDGELCFYIDDDYLYEDEREDYGLGRALIKKIEKPILDY